MEPARLFVTLIGFGVLLISGCKDQPENKIANSSDSFPVIVDTVQAKPTYKIAKEMPEANYNPLYIGPYKDTLIADYHFYVRYFPVLPVPLGGDSFDYNVKESPLSAYYPPEIDQKPIPGWKIKLTVDTSTVIKTMILTFIKLTLLYSKI
jgi:hypothetical protein